jgi:hypothetical protein
MKSVIKSVSATFMLFIALGWGISMAMDENDIVKLPNVTSWCCAQVIPTELGGRTGLACIPGNLGSCGHLPFIGCAGDLEIVPMDRRHDFVGSGRDATAQVDQVKLYCGPRVQELTAGECRDLGCAVQFDVNCPRTGDRNPTDRYRCKCSEGSAGKCIDE